MPIPLRADLDAQHLRGAAHESTDGSQTRRLPALAAIYDGALRTEAARIGGVTLQIVRDWVLKLNAHGTAGLIAGKAAVWPFVCNNWLSDRVFTSYDAIVGHCCDAWNKLADQPWRVMSLGLRDWATSSAQ